MEGVVVGAGNALTVFIVWAYRSYKAAGELPVPDSRFGNSAASGYFYLCGISVYYPAAIGPVNAAVVRHGHLVTTTRKPPLDTLIRRPFGATGWTTPCVGMGTWNIGNQWGPVSDLEARETLFGAIDAGVELFDTAESYGIPYGLSEQRLGQALEGIRDQHLIVTKVGSWGRRDGRALPMDSVDSVRLCVHASLYRLRTDWIDVLLCHQSKIEDPSIFIEAFLQLREAGLVRACGISTNSLDVVKAFHAGGVCDVVEAEYSLLNPKAGRELLPYCREHNIAVLARGPLAKGLLSGKYDSETVFDDEIRQKWQQRGVPGDSPFLRQCRKLERLQASIPDNRALLEFSLRFAFSHDADPVVIPGAKSAAQAAMNAGAGNRTLDAAESALAAQLLGRAS